MAAKNAARAARSNEECDAAWDRLYPDGLKLCTRCDTRLPKERFARGASSVNGRQSYCLGCAKSYRAESAARSDEVMDAAWNRIHSTGLAVCDSCKQELPRDSYYRSRKESDGRFDICKPCQSARARTVADANLARENLTTAETAQCSSCRETKPAADFYLSRRRSNGLSGYCRECSKAGWSIRSHTDTDRFWSAHGIDPLRCFHCGGQRESIDHLAAKSNGGRDRLRNLVPSCMNCNVSKGNRADRPLLDISPQWWVGRIPAGPATEFVEAHHYTRTADAGSVRYGLFCGEDLCGVSIYNVGSASLKDSIFGPEHRRSVIHHHRLAIGEGVPPNTGSWFLSRVSKLLSEDRPSLKAIVSFADSDRGHVGTIYQALNYLYTGVGAVGHVYWETPDGHVYQESAQLRGMSLPEKRAHAEGAGWTIRRSGGRHRYVCLLGSPTQRRESRRMLRLSELPYPKA